MNIDSNPYSTPSSEIYDPVLHDTPRFYVVAPSKWIILFVMTLGLYGYYWFYKNWQNFKLQTHQPIWPIARGIFSIFFAHELFRQINKTLLMNRVAYSWNFSLLATSYVILALLSNISEKWFDYESYSSIVQLLITLAPSIAIAVIAWVLYRVQCAINMACLQPKGESNRTLTLANYIWIVLGLILWIFYLVGLYMNLIRASI